MKYLIYYVAVALLYPILFPGVVLAERSCLKISFSDKAILASAQIAVLKRVYEHAGLCMEAVILPNKRSEIMLSNGEIDGDAIGSLERIRDNVESVLVNEPLLFDKGVVVVRKLSDFNSISDLEGTRVGVKLGGRWERKFEKYRKIKLVKVTDRKTLFPMLEENRVQAIVVRNIHLRLLPVDMSKFSVAFDLEEVKLYHSLSTRHKTLAFLLAQSIRELQKERSIPVSTDDWVKLAQRRES